MAEHRVHIGSGHLTPEEVARKSFSTARRGFDAQEVRRYLDDVAAELNRLRRREEELENQIVELKQGPKATPAVDVATLTAALGEETARVLRTAQEAAVDLRARAEEGAARTLNDAHDEAARLRAAAEKVLADRTQEAEAAAAALRSAVEAEVTALRSKAEAEADAAVRAAVERGREMVTEAQEARHRMLADLARRRKGAIVQLERLRAGRERLLEAYATVRTTLEDVTAELDRADLEARIAAHTAGQRAAEGADVSPEELLAEDHLAEEAEPAPGDVDGASPADAAAPIPAEVVRPPAEADATPGTPGEAEPAPARAEPAPARAEPEGEADPIPVATLPDAAVGGAVDELFAKIRADRAEAVNRAHEVLDATTAGEGGDVEPAGAEADEAVEAGVEGRRSDEDERALQARDAVVEPLTNALGRRVKRLLQDEQNVMLDRLRTLKGKLSADAVLSPTEEHGGPYVEAVRATLVEVEGAGFASVGGTASGPADARALEELASEVADAVLDPLRAHLHRGLTPDAGPDEAAAVVGAAYREARSRRLERALGDRVTSAWNLGVRRGLAPGTAVRWIVEDVDGPCPDCDDNALAGTLPAGEAFPTGQDRPPAHPGCRCLLAPAPA